MKKKLSDKKMMMAYVLNKDPDFDCSMNKIGKLFNVSQSTISNAIKEVKYQRTIYDLSKQLKDAKNEIREKKLLKKEKIIKPISYYEE